MADNPLLDLAQTVVIERYGLDEETYSLLSFSEGKEAVTIKMSDGHIPVGVTFPKEFMEFEKMKRMTVEEKRARFMFLMPRWEELSPEVRELFSDVVDDWDADEPKLRHVELEQLTKLAIKPASLAKRPVIQKGTVK